MPTPEESAFAPVSLLDELSDSEMLRERGHLVRLLASRTCLKCAVCTCHSGVGSEHHVGERTDHDA